ncbi:MAG: hypothetical protein EA379_07220 [Phycisphaerales bacterium]|nr:MAG: hypothetical protein EA379_07220 [Phycisphaerales bacterium]
MLRAGHVIGLCVLALLCMGVVMVNSADMSVQRAEAVTFGSIIGSRSSWYMLAALVAMLAAACLPARWLPDARWMGARVTLLHPVLLIGAFALLGLLLMVYLPVLGREVKGSARWIHVPLIGSFQPSEVVKWGMLLLLALYAAWQGAQRMARFNRLVVGFGVAAVLSGVVATEDLGTGVLMMAGATVLLVAAGVSAWKLALFIPPAAGAVALAVFTSDYRMRRVTTFLNPFEDPADAGYHMIQSMTAVANGEVFGRGLGFGLQKFGYLPEDRTDFLFAVICEELGVVGASIVVALYLGVLWAGLSVLRRIPAHADACRLFALGVLATLGFQAVINIGVVTGLGPTKGIALPLLSSGGTGWILTALSLGVLIAMDRAWPAPVDDEYSADSYDDEPADAPAVFVRDRERVLS